MSIHPWIRTVVVRCGPSRSAALASATAVAAVAFASAAFALSPPAPMRGGGDDPSCNQAAHAPGAGFGSLVIKTRCEVPPGGLPLLSPLPKEPKTAGQSSAPPTPATPKTDDKKADETKTAATPPAPVPAPGPAAPDAPKAADSKPAEPKPAETKAADAAPPAPPASPTLESGFKYFPPGALAPQDSARGRKDRHVYLPSILFPLKLGAGQYPHMNSQIWGFGGGGWNGKGAAGGGECDPRNYDAMQQRDDYCEVRGWAMPMCPAGKGHQGQDIRPPTCKDKTWETQAVMDGIITAVTSNTTVRLKANDGTTFEYLHMHPDTIKVKEGQKVKQGDVLGRVSNIMNGKRDTTMHLHFQVRQQRTINGKLIDAYVPTFPSLIAALRRAKGLDPGIDANGDLIADARFEIGAVAQAPTTPPTPAPKPEPPQPAPEPPKPAPEPPKPAPEPPKPAPEPPKPAPEPPQPAPEPPKPAPEPPQPAPEPPQPAPEPPKPAPEPPKPAPEPPQPAPEPPKPAPEPPQPAPEPPKPAPEPPKPAPEPPKPAPEPPKPAPEPPKPAPEPKAEVPQPAPAPAPPPHTPEPPKASGAPSGAQQGWWDWTKDKASSAKGYADAAKDKVVDWWSAWRSKK